MNLYVITNMWNDKYYVIAESITAAAEFLTREVGKFYSEQGATQKDVKSIELLALEMPKSIFNSSDRYDFNFSETLLFANKPTQGESAR